jgi:hypothetical protein
VSRNALPPARRPSERALDALLDPGIAVTSVVSGPRGVSETTDTSATADTNGVQVTSDVSGTSDTKRIEPRDHVKIRRALADEMRDAVWFLSEHGRPRVQLGELLDEAVAGWLDAAKSDHNGGAPFPHRGRLR